jgi:hypothetical protein
MDIICLQTADPDAYYDILCETSRTFRLYCKTNAIRYHCFIGVKRGYFPWHACFNRMHMIKEVMDSGYGGWILYVDADAYIANLKFDLAGYLQNKSGYAMIVRPGSFNGKFWDINTGVMLINGSSERAVWLINRWLAAFLEIPDETLRSAADWGAIPHDQELLEKILWNNPELESDILKDLTQTLHSGPECGGAAFIEQVIRAVTGDEEERRRIIRWNVAESLRCYGCEVNPALTASRNEYQVEAKKIVNALYEGLLGRPADESGLKAHTEALTRAGVAYIIRDLINGAEFRNRFRSLYGPQLIERSPVQRRAAAVLGALCRETTNRVVNRALAAASMRFGRGSNH